MAGKPPKIEQLNGFEFHKETFLLADHSGIAGISGRWVQSTGSTTWRL